MILSRSLSWLPLVGVLAAVALGLAWLFFGFAGERDGLVALPYAAGSTVEYWPDPEARATRDEVESLPTTAWQQWSGAGLFAAPPGGAVWARVTLVNRGAQPVHGVLANAYGFVDRMEMWIHADDGWGVAVSGEAEPLKAKALRGRDSAFPVAVPAGGERVAYLRATDYFRAYVRLEWWPEQAAFHAANARGLLAEGLYVGGLFALVGYHALLWLRLRLADIGWYVLHLAMTALLMLLVRVHLPAPAGVTGSPHAEIVLAVVLALSGFFLAQFARVYLGLKETLPRADRLARGLAVLMLGLAAGALVQPWLSRPHGLLAAVTGVGLMHITLLVVALGAWRAGVREARFFVLSFVCLIGCSLVTAVGWQGRELEQNDAMRGLMIGSALEMLLLSLSVADRFARVQERLVEETEQRRAIQEAYADELEVEVRERTAELVAANEDKDRMLVALGHDLRSPIAALTQRAELLRSPEWASRLEPLANFAGQAASAGRQLLLLIEDIVLWARLRTGVRPLTSAQAATGIVMPVVALHQADAERRGVTLEADVPEALRVQTDLVLAQTMVRNLVGNAVKAARGRVDVTAHAAGAVGVRIAVRDDGPGLPARARARLRGESEADAEDGMGLRLIREIGAALGATIVVSAAEDGGTEIGITLPGAVES